MYSPALSFAVAHPLHDCHAHHSARQADVANRLQFPAATYPNGVSPNPITIAGSKSFAHSPPFYPSPWGSGAGDWQDAYTKARAFVKQLTLIEKVNLTTGVG